MGAGVDEETGSRDILKFIEETGDCGVEDTVAVVDEMRA